MLWPLLRRFLFPPGDSLLPRNQAKAMQELWSNFLIERRYNFLKNILNTEVLLYGLCNKLPLQPSQYKDWNLKGLASTYLGCKTDSWFKSRGVVIFTILGSSTCPVLWTDSSLYNETSV